MVAIPLLTCAVVMAAACAMPHERDVVGQAVPKVEQAVVNQALPMQSPVATFSMQDASITDAVADTAIVRPIPAAAELAAEPGVLLLGRFDLADPKAPRFAWPGSAIVARFRGSEVAVSLEDNGWNLLAVELDGVTQAPIAMKKGTRTYPIATGLDGSEHTVRIVRRNEGHGGITTFRGFELGEGQLLAPPPRPARRMQFVGDSITCGFGTEGTHPCPFEFRSENYEVTYAALTTRYFGAEGHALAKSGWGMWRGADGSTAASMTRVYDRQLPELMAPLWDHQKFVPDVVVINLSTNDYGNGDPGFYLTQAYERFLLRLRTAYPHAYLLATTSPMLGGGMKTTSTSEIMNAVERRHATGDDNVGFLDFEAQRLSEHLGCGGHPGKITHARMAKKLEAHLETKLGWAHE